jgi:hypothetical protein
MGSSMTEITIKTRNMALVKLSTVMETFTKVSTKTAKSLARENSLCKHPTIFIF